MKHPSNVLLRVQLLYTKLNEFSKTHPWRFLLHTLFLGSILFTTYVFLFSAPFNFPSQSTLQIEKGATLSDVATELESEGIIRSSFLFKLMTVTTLHQGNILAGDYYFHSRQSMFTILDRMVRGEYGQLPIRLTVQEGLTAIEIAGLLEAKFNAFDVETFVELAKKKEGYLFPDTYYFLPSVKPREVISTMEENFNDKLAGIQSDIDAFGKPLHEVIIMASLLEKEARTTESRRNISGVLWKRLAIDMPLQVDAVFPYINGKNTFTLTKEDLMIDSPYNTYKYKGLPAGPIANPGLNAILAALHPTRNEYFYYLSDKDGNMHYSATFEGHKLNRARYLY